MQRNQDRNRELIQQNQASTQEVLTVLGTKVDHLATIITGNGLPGYNGRLLLMEQAFTSHIKAHEKTSGVVVQFLLRFLPLILSSAGGAVAAILAMK